jgi:hypothetical protein
MSSRFINGAQYAVSTALAAAVAFTTASNAAPPVLAAATTPNAGSIVVIKSGWTNLNETVAKVATETEGVSFTLGEVDTTDAVRYPAGEGAGTYEVASDFVGLSQVRDVAFAGGEQNFFEFQYVEDANGRIRRKPTSKSAESFEITMDYDPNLPWYAALIELDRLQEPVVLREILPGGDTIYYYGYISFNKVPTKGLNENMTNKATFSLSADPIRYAA